MKKYLLFATAFVALASCSDDTFVGENSSPNGVNGTDSKVISFGSYTKAVTRTDINGEDAANLLNKKFIVGGFKGALGTSTVYDGSGNITTTGVPTTGAVYNDYQVKWVTNTANTTTSNTNDWEYVGLDFLAPSSLVNDAGVKQSIKYWDYSASYYDFVAYSPGKGNSIIIGDVVPSTNQIKATPIVPTTLISAAYTLEGSATDLAECYIA